MAKDTENTDRFTYLTESILTVRKRFDKEGALSDATIKQLIEEVAVLLTRLYAEKDRIKKGQDVLYEKNRDALALNNQCKQLSRDMVVKDTIINDQRVTIQEVSFQFGEASGQINTHKEIYEGLRKENREILDLFSESKINCARFTTERDGVQRKLSEAEKDNEKILESMTEMRGRVEKLANQNVTLATDNKSLKEANTEAMAIKGKMLQEKDQLKDKIIEGEQRNNQALRERDQLSIKRDESAAKEKEAKEKLAAVEKESKDKMEAAEKEVKELRSIAGSDADEIAKLKQKLEDIEGDSE